jgi:thioester reductase-like protein
MPTNSNQVALFTGFPGFIGYNLIKTLLARSPNLSFYLLVEARLFDLSASEIKRLEQEFPGAAKRLTLVSGDITVSDLGIESNLRQQLLAEVTVVYHLAAIYDLAVPEATAHRINVDGTKYILDFCTAAKNFERLIYFSTCYVAGARQGKIFEAELAVGQKFKNHYESTKYAAEVLVQERWKDLPTVIIRPGIVAGDSRTGETRKYDGPYFMIQLLLSLPRWLPMVDIGPGQVTLNMVPVDYIIEGTAVLALQPGTEGKVYALADPNPLKVRSLWGELLRLTGHSRPLFTVPLGLVKKLLSWQWVRKLLKMPREVLDYFEADVTFDTTNAVGTLKPLGVSCPNAVNYLPVLVDFVKQHPDINPIRKQIY